MSNSNTWVKLIPLELKEFPDDKLVSLDFNSQPDDHEVGVLPEELRKLYSMYVMTQQEAEKSALDYKYASPMNKEATEARCRELSYKANALGHIFWIAVHDEFNLWNRQYVGIRNNWKVVWYEHDENEMPPFLRGGGFFRLG